jgi:hypothetical protein
MTKTTFTTAAQIGAGIIGLLFVFTGIAHAADCVGTTSSPAGDTKGLSGKALNALKTNLTRISNR